MATRWGVAPSTSPRFYAGLRPKEEASPPAARLAGELKRNYARRGVTLCLGDVIIAAVAIHNEITLLTDNLKGFPMEDLSLHTLPKT